MNTQIIENNRLLAKFLGNDTDEYGADVFVPKQLMFNHNAQCMQGIFQFDECYFDTDWNWLMAVIEKIEDIESIDVDILTHGTRIYEWRSGGRVIADNCADISFDKKIEHAYDSVVKFVKWYNSTNRA